MGVRYSDSPSGNTLWNPSVCWYLQHLRCSSFQLTSCAFRGLLRAQGRSRLACTGQDYPKLWREPSEVSDREGRSGEVQDGAGWEGKLNCWCMLLGYRSVEQT